MAKKNRNDSVEDRKETADSTVNETVDNEEANQTETSDVNKTDHDGEEAETAESDQSQEENITEPEEGDTKGSGGFFDGIRKSDKKADKKKDKKTEAMQERIDELEDRVKRQLAEFDNFRKRTEKEKSAMFETGAKSVIEKILPVIDNFERGLNGLPEEAKKEPFAEGMNMVYKQLMTELEKIECKPIEAVGTEFDPNLHNAVMQVESDEFKSGFVAQELQKGYQYRDSVVRHSMVAVVQ